jgi:hypothetical protein
MESFKSEKDEKIAALESDLEELQKGFKIFEAMYEKKLQRKNQEMEAMAKQFTRERAVSTEIIASLHTTIDLFERSVYDLSLQNKSLESTLRSYALNDRNELMHNLSEDIVGCEMEVTDRPMPRLTPLSVVDPMDDQPGFKAESGNDQYECCSCDNFFRTLGGTQNDSEEANENDERQYFKLYSTVVKSS